MKLLSQFPTLPEPAQDWIQAEREAGGCLPLETLAAVQDVVALRDNSCFQNWCEEMSPEMGHGTNCRRSGLSRKVIYAGKVVPEGTGLYLVTEKHLCETTIRSGLLPCCCRAQRMLEPLRQPHRLAQHSFSPFFLHVFPAIVPLPWRCSILDRL